MDSARSTQKFIRALKIRYQEYREEQTKNPRKFDINRIKEPFYACFHPIKAFHSLKTEGFGSSAAAFVIWIAFFLLSILEYFETGFIFNTNHPKDFNLLMKFATSSLIVLVWCIVNWSLCTLLDGKGTFREIWITVCYGLMPKLIFGIPAMILSNVLCVEENVLYSLVQVIIWSWCILLIFVGLLIIHEYSFSKTLFSCLLTVVGMIALTYLVLLFVSMVQQLSAFVQTIIQEITIRR